MSSSNDAKDAATITHLTSLNINLFPPTTKKELSLSTALSSLSNYILTENPSKCQSIIEGHLGGASDSAGELQGGSDEFEIYRLSLTEGHDNAAVELLDLFLSTRQGSRYTNILTITNLHTYLTTQCQKRQHLHDSPSITKLINVMFILNFGHIKGQVRHIDNMGNNLQVGCYMSENCVSTAVCELDYDGGFVTNVDELLVYFGDRYGNVPTIIEEVLINSCDTSLRGIHNNTTTSYFANLNSFNILLSLFGKLYLPIKKRHSFIAGEGETLIVSGNEVHCGPGVEGERMFLFGIGVVPDDENNDGEVRENEPEQQQEADGEIQYNPVTLHIDMCCVIFSLFPPSTSEEVVESKRYMFSILVELIKDCNDTRDDYSRLITDDRCELRSWVGRLVQCVCDDIDSKGQDGSGISGVVEGGVKSETMFVCAVEAEAEVGGKKKKRKEKKGKT